MTARTLHRNAQPRDRCVEWLPWAWCNLRRNPFGELTAEERAAVAVTDATEWVEMLRDRHVAIQFIGRAGRGKTTRLLTIRALSPDSSYVYVDENQPCPAIPWGRPSMIDEAQRLTSEARQAVFASGEPLVLATHRNLLLPLRSAGYTVATYRIGRENNARLLAELVRRRIDLSRLREGPVPVLRTSDAQQLVDRFGTDFRAIEGYLYEQVQTQCYSHGEMRFID